jgi:hypothetical protein
MMKKKPSFLMLVKSDKDNITKPKKPEKIDPPEPFYLFVDRLQAIHEENLKKQVKKGKAKK